MSIQQDKLTAIANAIRAKDSTTAPINANDFPQRIMAIPSGGGDTPQVGRYAVQFQVINPNTGLWETIERRCDLGESVTPPNAGDIKAVRGVCPDLTFQGWNYDALDFEYATGDLNVGAMYIPTDGYTWFKLRITATTGANVSDALNQVVYLYKSTNDPLTYKLEDLDGNVIKESTHTNIGNFSIPVYPPKLGDWWVKVKVDNGTYSFGNGTSSTACIGGSVTQKRNSLFSLFIGKNVPYIIDNSFWSCISCQSVTIPNSVLSIGDYAFYGLMCCTSLTIPYSTTSIGRYTFYYWSSCKSISIPKDTDGIGDYAFHSLMSCNKLIIPGSIIDIGGGSFQNLSSCRLIDLTKCPRVPRITSTSFTPTPSTLYVVPDELLWEFQSATNWTLLANYLISKNDYENTYGN